MIPLSTVLVVNYIKAYGKTTALLTRFMTSVKDTSEVFELFLNTA